MQSRLWKDSMKKRQEIIRQAGLSSSRGGSIPDFNQKVSDWVDENTGAEGLDRNPVGDSDERIDPHSNKVPGNPAQQTGGNDPSSGGNTSGMPAATPKEHPRPINNSTPLPSRIPPQRNPNDQHPRPIDQSTPLTGGQSNRILSQHNSSDQRPRQTADNNQEPAPNLVVLTQQHIAARQVLGKELLVFEGNPEDWPIFISSFQQSTIACGYTDAENLIRLQRCLRGRALETVKSRLLLPSGVTHVIHTLRMFYGRPELLIQSLIDKIHHVPPPKHDRLDTLIEFGISVQNLVDLLVAADQREHLSNPVLMRELVQKFPGSMRSDWVAFKSRFQAANLETFGEFMSGLVSAASEVVFDLPTFSASTRIEKRKQKETGSIHTHVPESSEPATNGNVVSASSSAKPCASCGRDGHQVADCPQFKLANVDARLKLIQEKGHGDAAKSKVVDRNITRSSIHPHLPET